MAVGDFKESSGTGQPFRPPDGEVWLVVAWEAARQDSYRFAGLRFTSGPARRLFLSHTQYISKIETTGTTSHTHRMVVQQWS